MRIHMSRVAPGHPTNLEVQRNTLNSVVLFWKPANDNIQVSGYYILRNNVNIGITPNRVYVDKTVKIGETYDYKVTAYTVNWVYSAYSKTARINITPYPGIVYRKKLTSFLVT